MSNRDGSDGGGGGGDGGGGDGDGGGGGGGGGCGDDGGNRVAALATERSTRRCDAAVVLFAIHPLLVYAITVTVTANIARLNKSLYHNTFMFVYSYQ